MQVDMPTGFLGDLKFSNQSKLFRAVVNKVEKKISNDIWFPNSYLFVDCILEEIKAVHGLLEQFIIGRFDSCMIKLSLLVKIMNRNLKLCADMLSQDIPYLLSKGQLKAKKKRVQKFLEVLLSSGYYIYMVRLFKDCDTIGFDYSMLQCKKIVEILMMLNRTNFKKQLIISKMLLMMMSINIKNNNFNGASLEFYEALTHLLGALRLLEAKNISNVRVYRKHRKNIMILLTIGFLNYQRMLIKAGCFRAWEVGFQIIKSLEQDLRSQLNSWSKYLRRQYNTNQQIMIFKKEELEVYISYATSTSDIIKQLTKQSNQNIKGCMHLRMFQTIKEVTNKRYPIAKWNSGVSKLDLSLQPGPTQGVIDEALSKVRMETTNDIWSDEKKDKIKRKNILKKKKFPSIDILESYKIAECKTEYLMDRVLTNESRKKKKESSDNIRKPKSKLQKNIFLNHENSEIRTYLDKRKKNPPVLHRLITDDLKQNTNISELIYPDLSKKLKPKGEDKDSSRCSFQHNITEVFRKLLIKNVVRLQLKELSNAYDAAKKKTKIRNYNHQLLEFQLHKSFRSMSYDPAAEIKNGNTRKNGKFTSILKSVHYADRDIVFPKSKDTVQNISSMTDAWQTNDTQKKADRQLSISHKRSKEVIRQMLKKITAGQNKMKMKKAHNNSHYRSDVFSNYDLMDI